MVINVYSLLFVRLVRFSDQGTECGAAIVVVINIFVRLVRLVVEIKKGYLWLNK